MHSSNDPWSYSSLSFSRFLSHHKSGLPIGKYLCVASNYRTHVCWFVMPFHHECISHWPLLVPVSRTKYFQSALHVGCYSTLSLEHLSFVRYNLNSTTWEHVFYYSVNLIRYLATTIFSYTTHGQHFPPIYMGQALGSLFSSVCLLSTLLPSTFVGAPSSMEIPGTSLKTAKLDGVSSSTGKWKPH